MSNVEQGFAFLRAFVGAQWRFRRLRGGALRRHQHRLAVATVLHAVRHVPSYRERFAGLDPADWQDFPTADRATMVADFRGFNTSGISFHEAWETAMFAERPRDEAGAIRPPALARGMTAGLSSGTSAQRGVFLVSAKEQATWAGFLLARARPSHTLRRTRVALFLRAASRLYESLQGSCVAYQYFELDRSLSDTVRDLNEFAPDHLAAPPSLLMRLAEEQAAGRLRLRLERVHAVAEVLEPQDARRLAEVFGSPPAEIYQCTEGLLAITCSHGSLHIQEDLVAIQFEPALPGLVGADAVRARTRMVPVITDLHRRTQPIIRYRLDDLVTLADGPCPCGSAFRVIERIEGRVADICHGHRRNGLVPIFPEELRALVTGSHPAIRDYAVRQAVAGEFEVHLVTQAAAEFSAAQTAVRLAFANFFARLACDPPSVTVLPGVPAVPGGRKRQRVCRISRDEGERTSGPPIHDVPGRL